MGPQSQRCGEPLLETGTSPLRSALMFGGGLLGNLLALLLLEVHRRRRKGHALFHVLVTALVLTDLLGTLALSPVVLTAYARRRTLSGLLEGGVVCQYFAFSMTFFSLATLGILLAMALERCLSIGSPYFYEKRVTGRVGYVSLAVVYLLSTGFSSLPLLGFSEFIQYCPGTWCFMDMSPEVWSHKAYALAYATLMLAIISSVVLCNLSVIGNLLLMHRRRKVHQGSSFNTRRKGKYRRSLSQEVEYLMLLVFMTVAFFICSVPLVVRIYINSFPVSSSLENLDNSTESSARKDLESLLLLSMNPIIDPWVFIILSPSVVRFLRGVLCKRTLRRTCQSSRSPHGFLRSGCSVQLDTFQSVGTGEGRRRTCTVDQCEEPVKQRSSSVPLHNRTYVTDVSDINGNGTA